MNYQEFCERWEKDGIKGDWPLIAVIERHMGAEGAEAAWWASRLHSHGILNGYRVYSRSKDLEALYELDRAIATVQRLLEDDGPLTSLAYERLFMELFWAARLKIGESKDILSDSKGDKEIQGDTQISGKSDSMALFDIAERGEEIRACIKRTIAEIERSPLTKIAASKINERGIALVDASRFIWQLSTGTEAPAKDLNPASRFGKFLADVFCACEVAGDPRSAFRAWAREQGSSP